MNTGLLPDVFQAVERPGIQSSVNLLQWTLGCSRCVSSTDWYSGFRVNSVQLSAVLTIPFMCHNFLWERYFSRNLRHLPSPNSITATCHTCLRRYRWKIDLQALLAKSGKGKHFTCKATELGTWVHSDILYLLDHSLMTQLFACQNIWSAVPTSGM